MEIFVTIGHSGIYILMKFYLNRLVDTIKSSLVFKTLYDLNFFK